MTSPEEVKEFLKGYFRSALASAGVADPPDSLDLIVSGVVDSFGFVDFVAAVERRYGVDIPIHTLDMDAFTTIGGFARAVADAG